VIEIDGDDPSVYGPPHGDVHLLCGHCGFTMVQQLHSADQIPNDTPPGVTFMCQKCRKYSLLRTSRET
jgi:hypothetical protein